MGNWETVKKSIDGGYTWRVVHNTHPNENVEEIIQHPNGDLFFGTYTGDETAISGVYKSSDLGDTWERIGLPYHNVMSVAVNSEGVLYAGTYGQWGGSYTGGIFKSDDLGVTWTELKSTLMLRSIVITPGDTIYAGCDSDHATQGGVFRSVDDGETWTLINSGFDLPNVRELSLGGDGHLYAIMKRSDQDQLFRSIEAVTGIGDKPEEDDSFAFSLYPNPDGNQLHIEAQWQSQPASVAIINMQGQILAQQTLQLPGTLTISHLPTGIYMLRLQTGATFYTQQFLKN
jgi:photosystem II stability/assembly factor-like uncharacterized protein